MPCLHVGDGDSLFAAHTLPAFPSCFSLWRFLSFSDFLSDDMHEEQAAAVSLFYSILPVW